MRTRPGRLALCFAAACLAVAADRAAAVPAARTPVAAPIPTPTPTPTPAPAPSSASAGPVLAGRDLGSLGGGRTIPWAVSEAGLVVGQSETAAGLSKAFAWWQGTLADLGALPGDGSSRATAVQGGTVAGISSSPEGSRAFAWRAGWRTPVGPRGSAPVAVNGRGQVVGVYEEAAFLWWHGQTSYLPLPRGYQRADVAGLTEGGDVAGTVTGPSGSQPVVWRAGQAVGFPRPARGGAAEAVNEKGQVAGWYVAPGQPDPHGFLWDYRRGAVTDIPAFQPGWLNNRGDALGYVLRPGADPRPGLFTGGRVRDLGPVGDAVAGLDDAGDVLGYDAGPESTTTWVWRDGRGRIRLDAAGLATVRPMGLSRTGLVVGIGDSGPAWPYQRGFVWDLRSARTAKPAPGKPAPTTRPVPTAGPIGPIGPAQAVASR